MGRHKGGFAVVLVLALSALLACVALGAKSAGTAVRAEVPRGVQSNLLAAARRQARVDGERNPHDIRAVKTTFGASQKALCAECESHQISSKTRVYLVAMRGHFRCRTCSAPNGGKPTPGTVITLVFIAKSLFRTELTLDTHYPSLSVVGSPVRLDDPHAPRRGHN